MKKIKNLIAILIIMFIICIVVIISIEGKHNTENEVVDEAYDEIYKEKYEHKLEIKKVTSRSDFVSIENCISNFLGALSNKNNQYVYSMLDKKYINNNDININNVLEKVGINNNTPGFIAEEIYTQTYEDILVYPVYGIIYTNMNIGQDSENYIDTSYLQYKEEEFYCTVIVDYSNMTFSITPNTKAEYENNKENYIAEESISKNQYNNFIISNYNYSNEEAFIQRYFEDYIRNLKYNKEKAYEMLLPEYREHKYNNITKFNEFSNMILEDSRYIVSYKTNYRDEYTEYICVDNLYNYYIFREYEIGRYQVLLDTYTILEDETIKEYNELETGKKIMTNINKYIEMINNKDYTTAYSVLDETFKNNYFGTVNNLEQYINKNFYKHNEIVKLNYEIDNDLYICKVTLKDATNSSNSEVEKTIIMQLKDNAEFVMSFNI